MKKNKLDKEKIKRDWENSKFCFCPYLGRTRAVVTPRLGGRYCMTCSKPLGM